MTNYVADCVSLACSRRAIEKDTFRCLQGKSRWDDRGKQIKIKIEMEKTKCGDDNRLEKEIRKKN